MYQAFIIGVCLLLGTLVILGIPALAGILFGTLGALAAAAAIIALLCAAVLRLHDRVKFLEEKLDVLWKELKQDEKN